MLVIGNNICMMETSPSTASSSNDFTILFYLRFFIYLYCSYNGMVSLCICTTVLNCGPWYLSSCCIILKSGLCHNALMCYTYDQFSEMDSNIMENYENFKVTFVLTFILTGDQRGIFLSCVDNGFRKFEPDMFI